MIKSARGETFSIILTASGILMLLIHPVMMMAEFVHENVQQHEGTRLGLGEPANHGVFGQVKANTDSLKDCAVCREISEAQFDPKVLPPGRQKNRAGFLPMVKGVLPIARGGAAVEHDALQSLGEFVPVGKDLRESLEVAFANDVAKAPPG